MARKKSFKEREEIASKTTVAMMGRSQFFWMLLPEELRNSILKAIGEISVLLMKRLTEYTRELQAKDRIVSTFLVTVLVARINKLGKFAISGEKSRSSNPIEYLFHTGLALDELYFPEDMVWLCGKVPTRVWWWLASDPVRRKRFFDCVRELFPDPIPVERRVDNGSVSGDAENADKGNSTGTE